MSTWAVVIPGERYEAERLIHHEALELTGLDQQLRPAPGDAALVVVDNDPPLVVALGSIRAAAAGEDHDPDDPQSDDGRAPLVVAYTHRVFDEPVPADGLVLDAAVTPVDPMIYCELAERVAAPTDRRTWLVSLDLPIEAPSSAEAARVFWSYVLELGPRELPAFVRPAGNELAMQAFVSGAEANQDPEEED
ncbi:MAG TPA: hypothetical protein VFX60_15170 [Micromonospora sp.]|nr:hypothetical protein [Micromonospora sp.]